MTARIDRALELLKGGHKSELYRIYIRREQDAREFCWSVGIMLDVTMLDHDRVPMLVPVILKDLRRVIVEEPYPAKFPSATWKARVTALA